MQCQTKKLHTYCVFETPNRWEPIVVTGHFAFWHTLQHFREVIFPFWHTLQHFREVIFSTLALGAFGEPKVIWGGFGESLGSFGEGLGSFGESLGRLWGALASFGEALGSLGEALPAVRRPPPARPSVRPTVRPPDRPTIYTSSRSTASAAPYYNI